jgi:hypothetical protein
MKVLTQTVRLRLKTASHMVSTVSITHFQLERHFDRTAGEDPTLCLDLPFS